MFKKYLVGSCLVGVLMSSETYGQVIFSDDFDNDSSADWIVIDDSLSETPDATVTFAHDYSKDTYQVTSDGVEETRSVPKNPFASGDTTLGLKLQVNSDDVAAEASVSLFPKGIRAEGDHALRFEMFMSYNGPAFGGDGSTEFATMGVGHSGELVAFLDSNAAVDGDGTFFAVSGEGGASRDFRAYVGDGASDPEFLDEQTERVGFTDMDGDGIGEYNAFVGSPLVRVFPIPPHETQGAPGKGWVRAEVRKVGDTVSWILNGQIIATLGEDQVLADGGHVMIGYSDPFSSIAKPGEENYLIIDNLRVVQLGEGDVPPVVGVSVPGAVVLDEASGLEVFQAESVDEGAESVAFKLNRTGSTAESLTLQYRLEGSAVAGQDYVAPTSMEVTFAEGESEVELTLSLIDDAEEERDETIELVINPSPGYETREGKFAVVPLIDNGDKGIPEPDLLSNAALVYEENFDRDVSSEWMVNRSSDDATATFGYDYAIDGIPPAPGSAAESTLGLKFTANESLGDPSHITASPQGEHFSGDYVLTFDLWMNVNGPLPGGGGGSTEFAAAGIGTTGDHLQTADDASDGAWILVTGEGGSSRDFRFFLNNRFFTEESGIYLAGTQNNTGDYYASIFPPGKSAPEGQQAEFVQQNGTTSGGQVAFEWIPVQIAKVGDTVTWSMKGVDIVKASQSDAPFSDSGNIFLGYSDWFDSVSDNVDLSFGLFDNVKVYQLSKSVELSLSIERDASELVLSYTGKLESATAVTGPWTEVANAVSPYRAMIATQDLATFYRVVE